jgi:hypothetical protein
MVYARQIREVAAIYGNQGMSSDQFVEKFSALAYNIHKNGDPEAIRLVDRIQSMMIDVRSGCMAEPQLRSLLRDVAATAPANAFVIHRVSFPRAQFIEPAQSVNQMSVAGTAFQMVVGSSGTSPAAECELVASHQA